ncbi:hypothetical protein NN561_020398 [Cricetulus griseus]
MLSCCRRSTARNHENLALFCVSRSACSSLRVAEAKESPFPSTGNRQLLRGLSLPAFSITPPFVPFAGRVGVPTPRLPSPPGRWDERRAPPPPDCVCNSCLPASKGV